MRVDWKSFKEKYIKPRGVQFPVGSIVFKGFQGSGKTLSMVHYCIQLQRQFPKCIIYSNVKIKGLKNFHLIETDSDVTEAISVTNGVDGVVLLLDEAHLFFNKKTGISLDVLTAISQQRKDRRRIILSSQIWEELDISLRKQVKHIVSCSCRFGHVQVNTISDGESLSYDKLQGCYTAKSLYTEVFKHNQKLYDCYDTMQKIVRNDEYSRDNAIQTHQTVIISSKSTKSLRKALKA